MKRPILMRVLAVCALALGLVLCLVPAGRAEAATAVATVGGTSYYTYGEAWAAVPDGGTVEVLTDWDTEASLEVPSGKDITVDLNGHMINRHLAGDSSSSSTANGEVFNVGDSGKLTVNGGDTTIVHNGRLSNGVWYADPSASSTNISGGVIAGGYSDTGAGGIQMGASSKLTLKHVTLCGNMTDDYWLRSGGGYGGGIEVNGEYSKIVLESSRIAYNYANDDGGGVYVNHGIFNMTLDADSSINNNSADGHGGGIYVDAKKVDISGGTVSNNTSGKDGGGIYINHKVTSIEKVTIDSNTAKGEGGGVFIDAGGDTSLSGCTITNNKAKQGGGVYDNGKGNSLGSCTITGNHASEDYGGGVYVSAPDDIGLSGVMTIRDNTAENDHHKNDLHLGSEGAKAYISSCPDYSSNVGIYVDRSDGSALSLEGTYMATSFFSDKSGWHVEWVDKASGGTRMLTWKTGAGSTQPDPTSVSPGTSSTGAQYNGCPVIKGTFTYPSAISSTDDLDSVFYYSDGLFANAATTYDSHLATMSLNLAMSAFGANAGSDTGDYTDKFAHVKQLLSDIGCDDSKTYISETYTKKPGVDTIGVAIAQKAITLDGEDYALVPIAIRGANYESEWVSNVTLGDGTDPASGEAAGFASAASQVYAQVESYVQNDPDLLAKARTGHIKFWVVGYSRAGATANLTSKRLVDGLHAAAGSQELLRDNEVYGYCFEAPQGGVASAETSGADAYNCIHNVINKADVVPLVAMSEMGFKRYGVDHYVPGDGASTVVDTPSATDANRCDNSQLSVDYTSSEYLTQRSKMRIQFSAINNTITFDDYFQPATVNYVTGGMGFTSMLSEVPIDSSAGTDSTVLLTAEGFEPRFTANMQSWVFGGAASTYRSTYANRIITLAKGNKSLQDALKDLMEIIYSKSPADSAGIAAAASGITGSIDTGEFIDLWWNVIRKWGDLSASKKKDYLDKVWAYLMNSNGYSPCVGDYLTDQEKARLAEDWPALGDFIFTLVSEDYNNQVIIAKPITGDPLIESQVFVGTFAYNKTSILQAHTPEVNLAWLRSYDDFYTDDTTAVDVDTSKVTVDPPTANLASGYVTGKDPLTLTSNNAGGAIFYRVHIKSLNTDVQSGWKVYQGPLALFSEGPSLDPTYTVEAYATAYGKRSETVTFTYKQKVASLWTTIADPAHPTDLTKTQTTMSNPLVGETITLDPKTPSTAVFVKWTAKKWNVQDQKWYDITEALLGDQATNAYATFVMPEGTSKESIEVKATYAAKTSRISLGIDTSTFASGAATLPTTAEWSCRGSSTWYCSSGWSDDMSKFYDYKNGKPVPITWTKGAESGGTTSYTASVTFFPVPAQHFTKTDTYDLPPFFSFIPTGIAVTVNGQTQDAVNQNDDGSVTISHTFQITDPPASRSVKVKCYDEYAAAEMTAETRTYEYVAGSSVSLPAPSVDDEAFVGWSKDGTYVTDANALDLSIDFTMPDSDLELTANYVPVVNELAFDVTAPEAGTALPTAINGCTATITNPYEIPVDDFSLTWAPTDAVAGYSTTYVATLKLSQKGLESLGSKFKLDNGVTVTMDGTTVSADSISFDEDGNLVLTYAFPATVDPNLVSVGEVDDVTDVVNGTSEADIMSQILPTTGDITTEAGDGTAAITWSSIDGYDPTSLDEQTVVAHGTITLPEGVANANNVSLDVTCEVTVAAKTYDLLDVTQPDKIPDQDNGVSLDTIDLPSTVTISTDPGGPTTAEVIWDVDGATYDPANTGEQTVVIAGTLVLPDHVVAPDEDLLTITLVFKVKAKEDAPTTDDPTTVDPGTVDPGTTDPGTVNPVTGSGGTESGTTDASTSTSLDGSGTANTADPLVSAQALAIVGAVGLGLVVAWVLLRRRSERS